MINNLPKKDRVIITKYYFGYNRLIESSMLDLLHEEYLKDFCSNSIRFSHLFDCFCIFDFNFFWIFWVNKIAFGIMWNFYVLWN
jgi:hypothetical protein